MHAQKLVPFEATSFAIETLHDGKNPQHLVLEAATTGDPGIYQEIAVCAYRGIGGDCIMDILVGLNDKGELRVLISAAEDPDVHAVAIYPQRATHNNFIEKWEQ